MAQLKQICSAVAAAAFVGLSPAMISCKREQAPADPDEGSGSGSGAQPPDGEIPSAVVDTRAGFRDGVPGREVLDAVPAVEWSEEAVSSAFDESGTTDHRKLLGLLLAAPEAEHQSLAAHVSNVTPDSAYAPVARLIIDSEYPVEVLDALVGDLHSRPDSIKLPVFAEILAAPDHPFAPEAQRTLVTYLRQDFGYPSERWKVVVSNYLQTDAGAR